MTMNITQTEHDALHIVDLLVDAMACADLYSDDTVALAFAELVTQACDCTDDAPVSRMYGYALGILEVQMQDRGLTVDQQGDAS